MDWADEVANQILDGSESEALTIFAHEPDRIKIATALRKAKADGMREAAEIMDALPTLGQFLTGLDKVRARASEIENPTP